MSVREGEEEGEREEEREKRDGGREGEIRLKQNFCFNIQSEELCIFTTVTFAQFLCVGYTSTCVYTRSCAYVCVHTEASCLPQLPWTLCFETESFVKCEAQECD